ncbi:MAG: methyltransferase regulatory domain-containing protein, partial [Halothiobacillaceae bacterium]
DFVRRRLKVGGVLYISYNTQPGWAAFAPMRHLMMEHARMLGAEGQGIVNRIDGAIAFAQRLLATNPAYARANPQIGVRMKKLESQNRHYLAHEYFNRDWHPMHFTTLARWLEPAKLQFACSAHFIDHVDAVNLTSEQQAVVNEVPDMLFCETVRDFMVNQQFRRDYWVKGQRRMSPLERAERLRVERVVLVAYRPDVSLKIKGALGDAEMSAQVYNPILDQLADHRVRSIGEIAQAVEGQGISFAQIVQAILILVGGGHLAVAQEDAVVQKAKKRTERLNAHLCMQARGSGDIGFLASPVTGGGLPVSRFEQLFLLAQRQGAKTPEDRARFVWRILDAQGQKLLKEGRTLKTPEENLAELADQARAFETRRLPILRALQII